MRGGDATAAGWGGQVAAADDIFKRVPPQNLEAEQSVLGAILLDNEAINQALEVLSADDFYRETHREIYRAMTDLTDRNRPVDAITLSEALRTRNALEAAGGAAYIAELAASVPTAANVSHYARIVREKAVLRTLASTATEIASGAFDVPANVEDYLDAAEHRVFEIAERRINPAFHNMREVTRATIGVLEKLFGRKEMVTGVPTGFSDFDRITAGLQPADLIIIAARPSMGKTALALNIAAHAAMYADPQVGVAFFSLEMSKEQLALRMLCSDARVDSARVRTGHFTSEEFMTLVQAADRLSSAKLFIDDSSDITPIILKAKCRRLAREKEVNLGLIIVDYLQLMRPPRGVDNRSLELAEISRSLKALAKELKVPVIALSQLNRQVETRPDRRPLLADLRESGAIEQDADVIAFIYRDEMYHRDSKEAGVAEVIVAKQRNGPTDTARLTYLSQYTRFENYAPDTGMFEEREG
ncbi:MAG: replicative DNA helicase [Candidatus Binataceae bacterium]|nr:replicative DNA helicase [Candidatus Binataceae bacterium]